jgi:hypothetical protein
MAGRSRPKDGVASARRRQISPHFRCTKCGTVGYVDTRMDWSEVIDFNKGVG